MENVLARLPAEVVLFAVNQSAHGDAERGFAVRLNRQLGDPYGQAQVPALLREVDPDVVLVHNDASHYAIHRRALAESGRARVVVYCPIDWERLPPGVPLSLAAADQVVSYTRFGDRVLAREFERVGVPSPPRCVIPHGVDTRVFRPVAGARRRLFGDDERLRDAFIVLNANRNIRRKRVDLTLRGFAAFAAGRPDAYLYLHMGMRDLGWDVIALAEELGIADRLLTTTREPDRPRVSDEQLNLIYAACDVGLNTSEAEGWGLVALEHAAAGGAQVVPDGSACAELWRDSGVLVPAVTTASGGHAVSPEAVADALARLYDDRSLLADRARRAREHALSETFDWDRIASEWESVLL
jgi:glycosyltransferase involved in cell wall biosynthesis